MTKITEAADLPENEKVYLKRDLLGWRVVEPVKDPVTGKINWFNLLLGGKKGLFMLIILLIISGMFYLGIQETINNYKTIADSPCDYCTSCHEQTTKVLEGMKKGASEWIQDFNISNLNIQGSDNNGTST